jgi:hypothetical protein
MKPFQNYSQEGGVVSHWKTGLEGPEGSCGDIPSPEKTSGGCPEFNGEVRRKFPTRRIIEQTYLFSKELRVAAYLVIYRVAR